MKYINALSVLALASTTLAQTFSDCDPTKKSGCPTKPGLKSDYTADFRQGASAVADWTATTGSIGYAADGGEFKIEKLGDGPTIGTNFYIFFGYVEVTMKAAPGAGIVSSFVMQSDDLDEIDWEWIGSDTARAQSNYFGKGNTTTYDRGQFHPVAAPEASFHTYAVNWTKETTTWLIDGNPIRTLNFADAVGGANYPQTPMNIRLGNWVAGDPKNAAGTIQWAGGLTDFSQGPFSMFVQSVKIVNYNPGTSYKYGDQTGNWQSIQVLTDGAQATVASEDTNKNSTTGPGAIPFDSSSAAAAAATGAASVVSINLGGQGQGATAAAESGAPSTPCSTVTGTGAAASASNGGNAAAAAGPGTTVSINVGGNGAAAAATGAASNSTGNSGNGGIVAQGSGSNATLPTYTIKPGGPGGANGGKTGAAAATSTFTSTAAVAGASSQTSFGLGSQTASGGPLQATTNAGVRAQVGGLAAVGMAALGFAIL